MTSISARQPRPLPSPGDLVITWYDDEPVKYGGDTGDQFTTLEFGVLSGEPPVRKCAIERVAPSTVPVPVQDPRLSVAKRTRAEMPYGAAGPWVLTLPGVEHPSWHRIKRDATMAGLRQLAILDWHAARAAACPGLARPCAGRALKFQYTGDRPGECAATGPGQREVHDLGKCSHYLGQPIRVRREGDWLVCLCGNTPDMGGFDVSTGEGVSLEGDRYGDWDSVHYLCNQCGRVVDQNTLVVVAQIGAQLGDAGTGDGQTAPSAGDEGQGDPAVVPLQEDRHLTREV